MSVEQDFAEWTADNIRLILAGLRNIGPTPLDYDEETIDAVQKRCIERYGETMGNIYFRNLLTSIPEGHKDLFPEIFEQ